MASSTTIDVEIDGEKDGMMDNLDFKDIPHDTSGSGKTHEFTNFPHSAMDSDDEGDDKEKLIKEEKKAASFWTFAYYQQFFDVETDQVGRRVVGSMMPIPTKNYLLNEIRPNPDLYGPFWICTTLIFTTAIAGNLANYFSMAGQAYHWQYDFHKVTIAATAIYSYWWLVPLAIWGLLWWRSSVSNPAKFTFLEMLCVYGYSLAIYVPISILWAIQVTWLQWMLVVLGACLSGSVLLMNFWPAVAEENKRIAIGLMVFIFVMHAALAGGFVLYFFHVPSPPASTTPVTPGNITLPLSQISSLKAATGVRPTVAAAELPLKGVKKSTVLGGGSRPLLPGETGGQSNLRLMENGVPAKLPGNQPELPNPALLNIPDASEVAATKQPLPNSGFDTKVPAARKRSPLKRNSLTNKSLSSSLTKASLSKVPSAA